MFKKIRLWLASKLVAGTESAGPRLTVEQAERKTWITLNLSENGPLMGGDEAEKRLLQTLRKGFQRWEEAEAIHASGLYFRANYVGDSYPREGCTLTITGRENSSFAVLVATPAGDIIETWHANSAEQLGLRVARWAGGKNSGRPRPSPALISAVSDFINLVELHTQEDRHPVVIREKAGLYPVKAQIALAKSDQGIAGQV